jgi:hypothetical protein
VKLDQRNGRAHRIGQQRAAVRAVYFIPRSRETRIVETIARKNRIRRRVLSPPLQTLAGIHPTLRPRLAPDSAYLKLRKAAGDLPDLLARRHKAGVEQLMEEMSREYLDRRRLDDLIALAETEA